MGPEVLRFIPSAMLVLNLAVFAAEPAGSKQTEPSILVECHGRLRHGVVAIGGETTGTTISLDCATWELKLPDDSSRAFAREHHKQPVFVIGSLRQVTGTEIPARWVVDVERICADSHSTAKAGATITILGKLHAEVADGTPRTVIEAGGIKWPLDFSKDARIQDRAKSLVSKMAVVKGRIERAIEDEAPLRTMIRVHTLEVPEKSSIRP